MNQFTESYPETEGGKFLLNVGIQLPNHTAHQPRIVLSQYENKFLIHKIFQRFVISDG
jgi:hypothetical protein